MGNFHLRVAFVRPFGGRRVVRDACAQSATTTSIGHFLAKIPIAPTLAGRSRRVSSLAYRLHLRRPLLVPRWSQSETRRAEYKLRNSVAQIDFTLSLSLDSLARSPGRLLAVKRWRQQASRPPARASERARSLIFRPDTRPPRRKPYTPFRKPD